MNFTALKMLENNELAESKLPSSHNICEHKINLGFLTIVPDRVWFPEVMEN